MGCFIAVLIVVAIVVGAVSQAISLGVYRRSVRTGRANPANAQLVSFIASFIVISAAIVIAGWIFLSAFRFAR